jgi:hypothetical protein
MSDNKDRIIKSALYTAVLNKLTGELSELEAKEVLLVNTYLLTLRVKIMITPIISKS